MTKNSGPEDGHDMVTGGHEEVTYCFPSTSSGKPKKNHFTSQPQFRRENTPATIETDQFLWPFSSWRITTILQTFIKTTTEIPNCQSHSPQQCPRLRSLSCLKTFSKRASKFIISWLKMTESTASIISWGEMRYKPLKTIMAQPERIWEKSWHFFEGGTKKLQSMATGDHKFQKLIFNLASQKVVDFLDEPQKLAKDAIGIASHVIIEQFIYAKMPPNLTKTINQVHWESGTFEQNVTHL